jgi:hypothetical protein
LPPPAFWLPATRKPAPGNRHQKATDLTAKIQEVAAADPAKLAELAPKVQDLATKAAAGGDDLSATCKALDEMMAELSK